MAVINELGRNSAAITYPNNAGAEQFPTFATIDKWLRNDTLQGTATASGTAVTGTNNTIFNTQVRAGDTIMLGGQLRVVQTVSSDTSFVVTSAFSPAVTTSSAVRIISYTLLGTANNTTTGTGYLGFSNIINGTVSVTNDVNGSIVNGVGTYFLSDLTNAVSEVTLTGTGTVTVTVDTSGVITGTNTQFATGTGLSTTALQPGDSIRVGTSNWFTIATVTNDTTATVTQPPAVAITVGVAIYKATNGVAGRTVVINGRVRTIASITSNTQFTVNASMDFFDSNLKVKTYPRGTVSVAAAATSITSGNVVGANFYWDLPSANASQVWIGDELRTFAVTSKDTATISAPNYYTGQTPFDGSFRQAVTSVQFKKDDTLVAYVNSGSAVLSQELRVGDDIMINGTECTVTQIISDTLFRVGQDLQLIPALSTVYKKKKLHGYVLEGTREGSATGGKFSSLSYVTTAAALGATQIIVNNFSTANVAYNFVKIANAGGPPIMMTGSVVGTASTTVNGNSTKFTTELHVGAEICIGGVYAQVATIVNDLQLTTTVAIPTVAATPYYRTVPLYTYITAAPSVSGTTTLTLGTPLRNSIGISSLSAAQSVTVSSPLNVGGQAEFIEFVYSAPNKSAEASVALTNQSLDRKWVGLRWWPMQSTGTFATSNGAYNLTVYERWVAGLGQSGGVGLNKADLSDNTLAVSGVIDRTIMSMTAGGFIYLFAKPRYFILQGKSFLNVSTSWLGCIEFERAQPEDVGTGLGTTSPVVTTAASYFGSISPTGTPNVSPWPCYAYFHSDRFPVGSGQVPTAPTSFSAFGMATYGVHGGIFACPRVHVSSGDLIGLNAHVYSACTITTGRWGHLIEQGGTGSYASPGSISAGVLTTTAATLPMPHLGHLVPINSNVYNSKRFMFSPVVVMGPAYDPDIRGRIFGLKVIPSALGSLMDTVSVTVDTVNDFYDSTAPATDHWVVTAPGNSVTTSNTGVQTYRFGVATAGTPIASCQYRSIEDATATTVASPGPTAFTNNFRFAIPA
jgi:hypothetical protein